MSFISLRYLSVYVCRLFLSCRRSRDSGKGKILKQRRPTRMCERVFGLSGLSPLSKGSFRNTQVLVAVGETCKTCCACCQPAVFLLCCQDVASDPEQAERGTRSPGGPVQDAPQRSSDRPAATVGYTCLHLSGFKWS